MPASITRRMVPLTAALALATLSLTACGGDDGNAEKVGNQIDQKVEDGKDKVGDGAEKAGDKAENLGDDAKQKTDG